MTAKAAMGENKGEGQVEDLLPGILDDIIFDKIVPKLEWKDFYILSSVSHAWQDAILSRRVFSSRVLSHSVETFIRVDGFAIALYSVRDNSWHKLPRIPGISAGQDKFPPLAQFVSMDGKIYVLGGMIDCKISNKVFVFDLAGQGRWKQCASMKQQRLHFGSAIMNGKIYAFGGLGLGSTVMDGKTQVMHEKIYLLAREIRSILCSGEVLRSGEVYDPKEDTWSPIRPMAECRFALRVTPIGEELFTYGGCQYDPSPGLRRSLVAYHPFKDEWRVVQHSWKQPQHGLLFTVHGNVFLVEADDTHGDLGKSLIIGKYDVQENSWTRVSTCSLTALIPVEYGSLWEFVRPEAVLVVDDEVLALVSFLKRKGDGPLGMCLFRITGLGSGKKTTSWELRRYFGPVVEGVQVIDRADYFLQKL